MVGESQCAPLLSGARSPAPSKGPGILPEYYLQGPGLIWSGGGQQCPDHAPELDEGAREWQPPGQSLARAMAGAMGRWRSWGPGIPALVPIPSGAPTVFQPESSSRAPWPRFPSLSGRVEKHMSARLPPHQPAERRTPSRWAPL